MTIKNQDIEAIDRTMEVAGLYAQINVLLECIKSSTEQLCTLKAKNENPSDEYIEFLNSRLSILNDLTQKIIKN